MNRILSVLIVLSMLTSVGQLFSGEADAEPIDMTTFKNGTTVAEVTIDDGGGYDLTTKLDFWRNSQIYDATVKITMDRMVKKGFLEINKIRNLQLFHSCISEVEARRGELRKMLKRAFGGALTPMLKFLIEHEGLSKEEAAQLRELVKKTVKRKN